MTIDFILSKYQNLRQFYKTDEEMKEHFLSGEVTMSVTDVLLFSEEYLNSISFQPPVLAE